MPIDTVHPSYRDRYEDWLDCRTAYEGQRAVRAAGVRYLPRLTGQTDQEYEAYKKRALFYSITSKTLSALLGMAIDQPPELKYPGKMSPYFEDKSGTQFHETLANTITEVLLMGRFGVLVDRPANGGAPFITCYPTESIINWRVNDETGALEHVVLKEGYTETSESDKYLLEEKVRYRELEIIDGQLWVTIHKPMDAKGQNFNVSTPMTITNTGVAMSFIPFFSVNTTGIGIEPGKPPMQDIVDINYSHYRTSADLEHGRHFTGLPTPYVTGAEGNVSLHIGSTKAWVIPDPNARVGFLEFTGQGLASLEKALQEKQSQLASLSARLVDNSTRGSEAAETVRLRYLSETASLRTIVRAAEAFLNAVYNCISFMEGLGENSVNITLNKEFLDSKMTPAELTAWVEAYIAGGVTKEMLLHAFKTGKALPPPGTNPGEIPDRSKLIDEQNKLKQSSSPSNNQ